MLFTDSNGLDVVAAGRTASTVWVMLVSPGCRPPRTRVTTFVLVPLGLPAQPFSLARQLDGLHLLELDGALGHQVVEVAVGRAGNLRAIEIDLERAAMILVGPGGGVADAFHPGRHPILLLVEGLGDILTGGTAVLGGPVEGFLHVQRSADGRDVMHRAIHLARRVGNLRDFLYRLHAG